MQLYFLRHGQSVNNLLWVQTQSNQGRSMDPGLTPLGQQQADLLGQFLSQSAPSLKPAGRDPQNLGGFGITHIYSSLMSRAVGTGLIIARYLDLPLQAWEDIHEEGGIYLEDDEGQPVGQAGGNRLYYETNFPGFVLPETLGETGWWNRPYETPDLRPARARRFLKDLHKRHGGTDDHVAVVSHGGFYNLLIGTILDLPRPQGFWFSMSNCAITRLDFMEGETAITYTNRVDFLPRNLIT